MSKQLQKSVIALLLRGEAGCSAEWIPFVEVGREWYRDGKDGRPYELDPPPEGLFPAGVVEAVDNFLLRCWEQGRQDGAGRWGFGTS